MKRNCIFLFLVFLITGNILSQPDQNVRSIFNKIEFGSHSLKKQCFIVNNKDVCLFSDNGNKLDFYNSGYILSHSDNSSQNSNFQFFKFDFNDNIISVIGEIEDKTALPYKLVYTNGLILVYPGNYSGLDEFIEFYIYHIENDNIEEIKIPNILSEIITKVEILPDGKLFIESQTMGSGGYIDSMIFERNDGKYELLNSHSSQEIVNNDFKMFINELLEAINVRDLDKVLNMVSSNFYYSRDFGGRWNNKLSYKDNFIQILNLDNSMLKPEYYDSGWYDLKILLLTSVFDEESIEDNELCSKEVMIELENYTYVKDRICFEVANPGEFLISGYIGGGD